MRSSLSVSLSLALGAAAIAGAQAAPQPVAAGNSAPFNAPSATSAARPTSDTPKSAGSASKPAATARPAAAWKPYQAKDGSFHALLPAVPSITVQRDGISEDRPVEHLYVARSGDVVFVVEYTDDLDTALEAFGPQRLLTSFDWGFFREAAAKRVLANNNMKIAGVPARTVDLTTMNGRSMVYWSCIIGGRFYHWGTSAPEGVDAKADTARFFASFVPGRPGAAVPAAGAGKVASAASAASTAPVTPAVQPAKPVQPKRTPWRVVRVPEGGFSVLAPEDKPDEATVQITPVSQSRKPSKRKKAPARKLNFTNEAESYSAGWEPVETASAGDLWNLRERTAASLNGKVLSSVPVEKDGCAGEELHLQLPDDLSAVVRVYQSPGRVYTLTAITPMERSYSEGTQRFLNSFKLLKK